MKVGLDGRGAIWYKGTGIGTYTKELIIEFDKKNLPVDVFLPGREYKKLTLENRDQFFLHDYDNYWQSEFLPDAVKDLDLYHIPQNGIGLPIEKNCRFVVTIHDLIPYLFPETVGRSYLREFLGEMPRIIEMSDGIITVSDRSKQDILDVFHCDENKIKVIYEAAEGKYVNGNKEENRRKIQKLYGFDQPYIVYTGGFSMRKNVKALIVAYYILNKEHDFAYNLVLAGKHKREGDQYEILVDKLGLGDKVIFTDYVPSTLMNVLYNGADLMVYPTFYEGFGLPPLEAMACGCPVLSSSSSSLPEVLGDGAMYFDPYSTLSLAEAIYRILSDRDKQAELITEGLKRASVFSWEKAAKETWDFYEKIINR